MIPQSWENGLGNECIKRFFAHPGSPDYVGVNSRGKLRVTKVKTKRWIIATPDSALRGRFARELDLPLGLAAVLVNRGFRDEESARQFLNPQLRQLSDPFELPDMAAAVDRVLAAIDRRERIIIYGDYDVDGVTSTALLWRVLHAVGATVENFLPHRMTEGYGLSAGGISRCLRECKPDLLIAVDCGTSSVSLRRTG